MADDTSISDTIPGDDLSDEALDRKATTKSTFCGSLCGGSVIERV